VLYGHFGKSDVRCSSGKRIIEGGQYRLSERRRLLSGIMFHATLDRLISS
jgi:hypothetical protein